MPALANAPKAAPAVDDDGDDDHISPGNSMLKIIFLFPRWDMLISWTVYIVWVCINICIYILYIIVCVCVHGRFPMRSHVQDL